MPMLLCIGSPTLAQSGEFSKMMESHKEDQPSAVDSKTQEPDDPSSTAAQRTWDSAAHFGALWGDAQRKVGEMLDSAVDGDPATDDQDAQPVSPNPEPSTGMTTDDQEMPDPDN
jgi:hypothetical protein